jgi:DNA invertase Pin-like site-specific DNA recombinase
LLDDFKSHGMRFRLMRDGIATDPDSKVGGVIAQAVVTTISAFAQLGREQLSESTRGRHGRSNGRRPKGRATGSHG